jgi:hypothetical protein
MSDAPVLLSREPFSGPSWPKRLFVGTIMLSLLIFFLFWIVDRLTERSLHGRNTMRRIRWLPLGWVLLWPFFFYGCGSKGPGKFEDTLALQSDAVDENRGNGISGVEKTFPRPYAGSRYLCADEAEERAVRAIEKMGGRVDSDFFGSEFVIVSFFGAKVTDADLSELTGLRQLHGLYLHDTAVTDMGLKVIAKLKNLQLLSLGGTRVTDAGLKELTKLHKLEHLELSVPQVTDAGLKELTGLKQLKVLDLSKTKVSLVGLKELSGLQSLIDLYLRNTRLTDAGFK